VIRIADWERCCPAMTCGVEHEPSAHSIRRKAENENEDEDEDENEDEDDGCRRDRAPTSNFQLPTSNFQLPTSYFLLPTSNFQLPTTYYLPLLNEPHDVQGCDIRPRRDAAQYH